MLFIVYIGLTVYILSLFIHNITVQCCSLTVIIILLIYFVFSVCLSLVQGPVCLCQICGYFVYT